MAETHSGMRTRKVVPFATGIFILPAFSRILANLPKLVEGDFLTVETSYGTFEYKMIGSKIIKDTDVNEVPIQKNNEMLMIYTCWPINNIGHATERYVVYANLVK